MTKEIVDFILPVKPINNYVEIEIFVECVNNIFNEKWLINIMYYFCYTKFEFNVFNNISFKLYKNNKLITTKCLEEVNFQNLKHYKTYFMIHKSVLSDSIFMQGYNTFENDIHIVNNRKMKINCAWLDCENTQTNFSNNKLLFYKRPEIIPTINADYKPPNTYTFYL